MNFLADENTDRQIVERLRGDGHTLLYVIEMDPGISDDQVLEVANHNAASLITTDTDFGELVFRLNKIHFGVLLVRPAGLSPTAKAEIIFSAISTHGQEFLEAFTVYPRECLESE